MVSAEFSHVESTCNGPVKMCCRQQFCQFCQFCFTLDFPRNLLVSQQKHLVLAAYYICYVACYYRINHFDRADVICFQFFTILGLQIHNSADFTKKIKIFHLRVECNIPCKGVFCRSCGVDTGALPTAGATC